MLLWGWVFFFIVLTYNIVAKSFELTSSCFPLFAEVNENISRKQIIQEGGSLRTCLSPLPLAPPSPLPLTLHFLMPPSPFFLFPYTPFPARSNILEINT